MNNMQRTVQSFDYDNNVIIIVLTKLPVHGHVKSVNRF